MVDSYILKDFIVLFKNVLKNVTKDFILVDTIFDQPFSYGVLLVPRDFESRYLSNECDFFDASTGRRLIKS